MTIGLVQFIRARLEEDERIARQASDGPWLPGIRAGSRAVEGDGWTICNASDVDAEHIARWGPTRVLREIDAKRRVVDECAYWHEKLEREAVKPSARPYPCHGEILDVVTPILRALSLPYADHPDYRDEWRPQE